MLASFAAQRPHRAHRCRPDGRARPRRLRQGPECRWLRRRRRRHPRQCPGLRRECRRPRLLRDRLDRSDPRPRSRPSTSSRPGCSAIRATPSLSKAMPTSAARANTTIRSAPRRAQTVRDYLASRGIGGNRIRTISYGKERPVAVCNDISCWSQNPPRRDGARRRRRRLIQPLDKGLTKPALTRKESAGFSIFWPRYSRGDSFDLRGDAVCLI
jgi:hypothetical protein